MILIHFLCPNPGAAAETNKLRLRPHIFEFGTFSFRIEKFPHPQVFTFKSNLSVHTYPTRIRIHSSTQCFSAKKRKRIFFVMTMMKKLNNIELTKLRYTVS